MNGVLDEQTSGNQWDFRSRTMLHESLHPDFSPTPNAKVQLFVIDDWEQQMAAHDGDFAATLKTLQQFFIFTNPEDVENFLRSHRSLVPILLDAAPHFRQSFAQAPLALDIMNDEGAPRTIYALALWRGNRADAKAALNTFDDQFWLDNLRKAAGRIVFDYELLK